MPLLFFGQRTVHDFHDSGSGFFIDDNKGIFFDRAFLRACDMVTKWLVFDRNGHPIVSF